MKDNSQERLKALMEGKGGEKYVIEEEMRKTQNNVLKIPLGFLMAIWCMFFIYYAYLNLSNRPTSSYNFNPVSKIVLKTKAGSYMEENYPEYKKDMTVDTNTGMIKNKSGYTVVYKDENNNKVVIYFDRDFNIKNVLPQIKQNKQ